MAVIWDGEGVENAGEDAAVGANVFEDGNGVESGLIIVLGRFESWGIDGEGVE